MCCKADAFIHILWNAKHFSVLVENTYLVGFEYTDFPILISPFTANPGYWQMCVGYILAWNASAPRRDEVTTDLLLLRYEMKYNLFHLISTIIPSKVLTLLEPLAEIFWNLYVLLKCYIDKWIDISQLYKIICCSNGWHTRKTILYDS